MHALRCMSKERQPLEKVLWQNAHHQLDLLWGGGKERRKLFDADGRSKECTAKVAWHSGHVADAALQALNSHVLVKGHFAEQATIDP